MASQALIRIYVKVLGETFKSHETFIKQLDSPKLREVDSVENCDVIFAFVPIVSRAGTDISSVMEKIPTVKRVILVVLHHTFDPDYVAPDSRFLIKENRAFTVDCLYYEDGGLLNCPRNDNAIRAVKNQLRIEDHIEDVHEAKNCDVMEPRNRKWLILTVAVVICVAILIIVLSCVLS